VRIWKAPGEREEQHSRWRHITGSQIHPSIHPSDRYREQHKLNNLDQQLRWTFTFTHTHSPGRTSRRSAQTGTPRRQPRTPSEQGQEKQVEWGKGGIGGVCARVCVCVCPRMCGGHTLRDARCVKVGLDGVCEVFSNALMGWVGIDLQIHTSVIEIVIHTFAMRTASKSGWMTPFDGDAFLTSAIRPGFPAHGNQARCAWAFQARRRKALGGSFLVHFSSPTPVECAQRCGRSCVCGHFLH
jgi:hypothetical protein